MDTLALLCNLHADGPATLQRLRRIGCESLAALRRLDATTLAESLGWSDRAAERFLREAVLLRSRTEENEGVDEVEETSFELESTLVEELDGLDEEAESEEEDEGDPEEFEEEDGEEVALLPAPEETDAVLGAWRELDRVAPPAEPGAFVIPRPEPEPDETLAAAAGEWIPAALLERLGALGIRTLRELTRARDLELSRSVPLGFTRVKHLQFRAAQELASLGARSPAPAPAPQAFGAFTPQPSPHETAGPFA